MTNLSNLKPAENSTHRQGKRVGRGQGSGKGGTSKRGHKGAKQRSGYSRKVGFEGGQMPLQRRIPKFGFKNFTRVEYAVLNLDRIQELVAENKIKDIVDMAVLIENRLIRKTDLVKVLNRGELKAPLKIYAHKFSEAAKNAIESAGGQAISL